MARQKLLKMKPNLPMREKNMRTEKRRLRKKSQKVRKSLLMQKNRIKKIKIQNGMYTIGSTLVEYDGFGGKCKP